jgi:uncharacterized delta-60 repeat protein
MKLFQTGLMGVSLVISASAHGASGEVDLSFGGDGDGRIGFDLGGDYPDTPRSIALDPDGNIVASGSAVTWNGTRMAIGRLTADGAPDFSFYNGNNRRTFSPVDAGAASFGLVITSNGPCLAGTSFGSFSSNALTACFGADQILAHSTDPANQVFSWSVVSKRWTYLGNDFFYVAGTKGIGDEQDFAVARLQWGPAGLVLDPTFGKDGYADSSMVLHRHQIKAIAGTEDNGLYLAGCDIHDNQDFAVVKLLPSGDPDSTFDGNGLRYQYFGQDISFDDCATAMAIDDENRIVLAGTAARDASGNDLDIALWRVLPNGADDLSFGPDGKRLYSFSKLYPTLKDEVSGIALDSQGRIYVVGTLYHPDQQDDVSDVAVMRLKHSGEIDTSFGTEGRALFSAMYEENCAIEPISAEKGVAIVMQDVKPVILAEYLDCNPGNTDFLVLRLLPDDQLFADGFEGL